ncbi:site-specific integrase [Shewanella eurypsychrophilus]|uniref:Site-specific integrase n=1 Tax=Shewanella eurypsychrophilus TaxID=2593656 RepID=A0ABX6V3Z1_9GAMM|nr:MULTISPECIES: site-specific integrase [Shewanella]QFU21291.1 site-specific integrase [Shewanella sp. YLB-09]QPG56582.1 site-specific integrase [Shewanella eurypsychrophilus]
MSKQIERHNISDKLYVYLQSNSKYWYCRFVLYGKWYAKATKKTDLNEAIAMAHRIFMDYEIRAETNTLIDSKRFKDVAEKAIDQMLSESMHGGGKVIYKDYIGALRKYHIPYFDRTFITSIDQEQIREFDKWRIEEFKRIPAKSTIQTHNAALQMVFKEAVVRKWMLPMQVPVLNSEGLSSQRRAAFSKDEYEKTFDAIIKLEENSRKEKTRQIRELLLDYMEFAVHTGIRPGTEMEGLTWGDIHMETDEHNVVFYVTVTKGKTTKHTGTREIVCRDEIFSCIADLRERFPNRKPSDKLFRLADGSTTKELGKAFDKALLEIGLKQSAHGVRTLYSLRHTYITWQLMSGEVSMEILAKQCGTSVQMIEQHYSHVVPKMFTRELSGVEVRKSKPKKKTVSPAALAKSYARLAKQFNEWKTEYKKRGCI